VLAWGRNIFCCRHGNYMTRTLARLHCSRHRIASPLMRLPVWRWLCLLQNRGICLQNLRGFSSVWKVRKSFADIPLPTQSGPVQDRPALRKGALGKQDFLMPGPGNSSRNRNIKHARWSAGLAGFYGASPCSGRRPITWYYYLIAVVSCSLSIGDAVNLCAMDLKLSLVWSLRPHV